MGQDQEALLAQALDHDVGDLLGLEHGAGRLDHVRGGPAHLAALVARVQHRGVHAHRAQAADADAAVAVGHRQPLGERDRAVLGDRVRARADLGEQPGRRRRREEVARAALQPARHQAPRRVHVRHDVDAERELPALLEADPAADAGVRAEQVDRPELRLGAVHQRVDLGAVGHVAPGGDRRGADLPGHALGSRGVDVGDDHAARAVLGEAPRERAPDARRRAGDDDDLAGDLHGAG